MFETDDPDALRSFTQQDLLASTIRVSLGALGPLGPIVGEFLTQFVPRQRLDRLHDFVEKLNERIAGLEEQFKSRTETSPGYAALTEQATGLGELADREFARSIGIVSVDGLEEFLNVVANQVGDNFWLPSHETTVRSCPGLLIAACFYN